MKTGQKTRLLGSINKANTMWERWYEAINEEEKLQSNKDIADLRGGTLLQHPRVLVSTVAYQENHLSAYRSSMQPSSRSFEVHTYCYGY